MVFTIGWFGVMSHGSLYTIYISWLIACNRPIVYYCMFINCCDCCLDQAHVFYLQDFVMVPEGIASDQSDADDKANKMSVDEG